MPTVYRFLHGDTFQSTRPRGRDVPTVVAIRISGESFNPHAREGVTSLRWWLVVWQLVSIHTPARA